MIDNCNWDQDEDGIWQTDCGELFEINEGTPGDNGMKFCCYCGRNLIERPFKYELGNLDER